ncbi:MAG: dienelactone hydrolase family protein [Alphaproteobacteria bacterium]
MQERNVEIKAKAGTIDAFVVHPDEDGPHPAVILYMDAPGIREELRDMSRRLATCGYYVLLPNMYFRKGTEGNYGFDQSKFRADPAERQKMFDVMNHLTNADVVEDTGAMLDFIRADRAARIGAVGCVGYCMSGRYVMSVGAAFPLDFNAIASYYGVGIITDQPDSPHLKADKIRGEVYLAFAEKDEHVADNIPKDLPGIMEAAGLRGVVEVYLGTDHGFAFAEREAVYVKSAGERHWERMISLFQRNL